jgi:hypothetical protein
MPHGAADIEGASWRRGANERGCGPALRAKLAGAGDRVGQAVQSRQHIHHQRGASCGSVVPGERCF